MLEHSHTIISSKDSKLTQNSSVNTWLYSSLRQTFLTTGFLCIVVITPHQFGFAEFCPVVSDLIMIFTFTLTD